MSEAPPETKSESIVAETPPTPAKPLSTQQKFNGEIIGLMLLVVGLLLSFSIYTPDNYVGGFGSTIKALLLQQIGWLTYFFPLPFFMYGVRVFTGRSLPLLTRKVLGLTIVLFAFLMTTSILEIIGIIHSNRSGVLVAFLSQPLANTIGVGGIILPFIFMAFGTEILLDLPPLTLFKRTRAAVLLWAHRLQVRRGLVLQAEDLMGLRKLYPQSQEIAYWLAELRQTLNALMRASAEEVSHQEAGLHRWHQLTQEFVQLHVQDLQHGVEKEKQRLPDRFYPLASAFEVQKMHPQGAGKIIEQLRRTVLLDARRILEREDRLNQWRSRSESALHAPQVRPAQLEQEMKAHQVRVLRWQELQQVAGEWVHRAEIFIPWIEFVNILEQYERSAELLDNLEAELRQNPDETLRQYAQWREEAQKILNDVAVPATPVTARQPAAPAAQPQTTSIPQPEVKPASKSATKPATKPAKPKAERGKFKFPSFIPVLGAKATPEEAATPETGAETVATVAQTVSEVPTPEVLEEVVQETAQQTVEQVASESVLATEAVAETTNAAQQTVANVSEQLNEQLNEIVVADDVVADAANSAVNNVADQAVTSATQATEAVSKSAEIAQTAAQEAAASAGDLADMLADMLADTTTAAQPISAVSSPATNPSNPKIRTAAVATSPQASPTGITQTPVPASSNLIPIALPNYALLNPILPAAQDAQELERSAQARAELVNQTLSEFGLQAKVRDFSRGPTVTRYEIEPAAGEKISRIAGLANDLARALSVAGVRVEAPVPGKSVIGLEVPNAEREPVTFHAALRSVGFQQTSAKLPLVLGKSIDGEIFIGDLARMPHVLIAGSTGSGKSVCVNTLICSLIYRYLPTELRFVMIDPKMVELTPYNGIPHLLRPVVTNPADAAGVLLGAVAHMERRYKMMSQAGAKNLEQYNQKMQASGEPLLPQIIIIIDELADLMITSPKEVESAIMRLAQMARATGMHLILATQRPSVDILTSLIKVNVPARIAFAVSSGHDSRTILDSLGAERLTGMGDMLFYQPGLIKPIRLQAPFISEAETNRLTSFLQKQYFDDVFGEAYGTDFEGLLESAPSTKAGTMDFSDPLLRQAAEICIEEGQGSVSRLQRRLAIGHARAGKLMDLLEAMGIVSKHQGSKPREVLIHRDDLPEYFGK